MRGGEKPAVIGEHLKIVGDVVAVDLTVELYGEIDGDIDCAVLIVARQGRVTGSVKAEKVVVRGLVEGLIDAGELVLENEGRVKGDINCRTVVIDKGAFLEGLIMQPAQAFGDAARSALPPARRRRDRFAAPQIGTGGRRLNGLDYR